MSPNYGRGNAAPDTAASWLLGGDRKRRIIEALAESASAEGMRASALQERTGASRITVFETLRALKHIGAVDQPARGYYRLDRGNEIGAALSTLVLATRALRDRAVNRPHRRRQRTIARSR